MGRADSLPCARARCFIGACCPGPGGVAAAGRGAGVTGRRGAGGGPYRHAMGRRLGGGAAVASRRCGADAAAPGGDPAERRSRRGRAGRPLCAAPAFARHRRARHRFRRGPGRRSREGRRGEHRRRAAARHGAAGAGRGSDGRSAAPRRHRHRHRGARCAARQARRCAPCRGGAALPGLRRGDGRCGPGWGAGAGRRAGDAPAWRRRPGERAAGLCRADRGTARPRGLRHPPGAAGGHLRLGPAAQRGPRHRGRPGAQIALDRILGFLLPALMPRWER